MHGLAGTTAAVALVPVTLLPGRALGLAYLACFGVGVTSGMATFALVAALAMRRAADRAPAAVERMARDRSERNTMATMKKAAILMPSGMA